ncbi:MAG: hypothetical protein RL385_506 [Pseudomonadota bacterium]|jgi:hypothetical protein
MKRLLLITALAVCMFGCGGARKQDAPVPTIAPRLGKVLQLNTVSDAEAMRRRDAPSEFGELTTAQGPKRPRNCVEWEALHATHAEPSNDAEEAGDEIAGQRCDALLWLTRVRPATRSFVAWSASLAPRLPATIATAWDDDARAARDGAAKQGKTINDYAPDAALEATPDQMVWSESGGTTKIVVRPIAWGDLNGDGVEDLLLAISNLDSAGPMTEQRVLAVTRNDAQEALRAISR